MEPRTEERESRFRFDKLEARIAPTADGLCIALAAAETGIAAVDGARGAGSAQAIVDNIGDHNPQAPSC